MYNLHVMENCYFYSKNCLLKIIRNSHTINLLTCNLLIIPFLEKCQKIPSTYHIHIIYVKSRIICNMFNIYLQTCNNTSLSPFQFRNKLY